MSFWSTLGGIFDEGDQAQARQSSDALANALQLGSPYYQTGQLTGDEGVQQGAAQLAANKVGVNTSNLDADTAAYGQLGDTFGDIRQNGGQLTHAVLDQARSDLANTGVHQLDAASRQAAGNVLAQDSAERNWAAGQQNKSRAQQLAAQLQKQVWSTAVSHANFESALNAQALKNEDRNAAFELANSVASANQGAGYAQRGLDRAQQAQDFNNAMAALRAAAGAASSGGSTLADMTASGTGGYQAANSTGQTLGAQTYDAGYAVPQASLGTSRAAVPAQSTMSKYVNPVTGNTVNLNMPADKSSWGDWLTGTSTLASV